MTISNTRKTFLDLEPDLQDALCALQILYERLESRSPNEDQDRDLYIAGRALGHLQNALAPLPLAA